MLDPTLRRLSPTHRLVWIAQLEVDVSRCQENAVTNRLQARDADDIRVADANLNALVALSWRLYEYQRQLPPDYPAMEEANRLSLEQLINACDGDVPCEIWEPAYRYADRLYQASEKEVAVVRAAVRRQHDNNPQWTTLNEQFWPSAFEELIRQNHFLSQLHYGVQRAFAAAHTAREAENAAETWPSTITSNIGE